MTVLPRPVLGWGVLLGLVLWAAVGITPDDVYAALRARESQSGLAEKASRKP